jgi:hypothetical protein
MPDFDPAAFTAAVTNSVRMWLAEDDDPSPDAFAAQRYGRSEALSITREAEDAEIAARFLRSWFTDRLTVDPGHPGPFGNLAFDLIGAALDLVDWPALAEEIREEKAGEEWKQTGL